MTQSRGAEQSEAVAVAPPVDALVLPRAILGERLAAGVIAIVGAVLLGCALTLTPSSAGLGTHTQLGLPSCHFRVVTGHPCPSCGMTTAFASFVRGDIAAALSAQVLGTVLAAATLLATLGGAVQAVTGVNLGLVTGRIFLRKSIWVYVFVALALGSWALKAWTS